MQHVYKTKHYSQKLNAIHLCRPTAANKGYLKRLNSALKTTSTTKQLNLHQQHFNSPQHFTATTNSLSKPWIQSQNLERNPAFSAVAMTGNASHYSRIGKSLSRALSTISIKMATDQSQLTPQSRYLFHNPNEMYSLTRRPAWLGCERALRMGERFLLGLSLVCYGVHILLWAGLTLGWKEDMLSKTMQRLWNLHRTCRIAGLEARVWVVKMRGGRRKESGQALELLFTAKQ